MTTPNQSAVSVLREALAEAVATFRRYEVSHRAKNTDDSNAKAEVNAELAGRFELILAATEHAGIQPSEHDEPTHKNHPGHHDGHTCEAMGQMLGDFGSQRTTPEKVVAAMQGAAIQPAGFVGQDALKCLKEYADGGMPNSVRLYNDPVPERGITVPVFAATAAQQAKAEQEQQLARDWPEDFEHENGNYMCNCSTCGKRFFGHKRRVTCKLCATPASKPEAATAEQRAAIHAKVLARDDEDHLICPPFSKPEASELRALPEVVTIKRNATSEREAVVTFSRMVTDEELRAYDQLCRDTAPASVSNPKGIA